MTPLGARNIGEGVTKGGHVIPFNAALVSALHFMCVRAGARVLVCASARARAPLCRRAGPRGRRLLPDAAEPQPEWWPDRHARSPPQQPCRLERRAGGPVTRFDSPSLSATIPLDIAQLSWVAHARTHGAPPPPAELQEGARSSSLTSTSQQRIRFPILTFATKKLSNG